jgi:hypothetical protein
VWNLPKLNFIFDIFTRRFSSVGDYADKIALLWLVIHQFLLESGSLQGDNLMLMSYEELTKFPLTFRNMVEKQYFCGRRMTKPAPPLANTRRLFFSERVSPDLLDWCNAIYVDLEKLRIAKSANTSPTPAPALPGAQPCSAAIRGLTP